MTLYWYFLGKSNCLTLPMGHLADQVFVWITCIVCCFVFHELHGSYPETLVCCHTIIFFNTEGKCIPVSLFLWNYFPWFSRTLAMFQNFSNQSNFVNCQNEFSLLEFIWHDAFNICSTSSLLFFYFCCFLSLSVVILFQSIGMFPV